MRINPIRAPLRLQRICICIALPHTKAVPLLKHSLLAYIPVPCRIGELRLLRLKR